MLIARWKIEARFGHRQEVIGQLTRWAKEIAPQIGWTPDLFRILSASIGGLESTVETEVEIADLATLDKAWSQLAEIPAHQQWGKELEPHVVSGTNRWEVLRIVE